MVEGIDDSEYVVMKIGEEMMDLERKCWVSAVKDKEISILMHGAMPPATTYIWRLGPESRESKLSPTPRRNSKFIAGPSSSQRVLQL